MAEKEESEMEEVLGGESVIIHDLGKGLLAGLAGTAGMAVLFLLQKMIGIVPQFDFIDMLTKFSGSSWSGAGWIILFVTGTVLGACFALLDARVEIHPGTDEPIRGLFFGALIWLTLMIVFMPFYAGGFFALGLGIGAPIVMLVANLLHGWLVGYVYCAMNPENTIS